MVGANFLGHESKTGNEGSPLGSLPRMIISNAQFCRWMCIFDFNYAVNVIYSAIPRRKYVMSARRNKLKISELLRSSFGGREGGFQS